MILYFADRSFNIIGMASTGKNAKIQISNDNKCDELDTGGMNFVCYLSFSSWNRKKVKKCAEPGNYLLRKNGDENEFYTIIDSYVDTKEKEAYIYAEEGGLDLLNEIALPYEADQAYPIAEYIAKFTSDSGFEIGINEIPDLKRTLKWESESTVTERILSTATQFDNAELAFRFDIIGLTVAKKYIDIFQKRGRKTGEKLRVGKEIDRLRIKKSIGNLATALYVTGGMPEGAEHPITLEGLTYDDGRFFLEGPWLKDREANAIWSRYLAKSETGTGTGYLMSTYSYDTIDQEELLKRSITRLKKLSTMEVNYETDIIKLPKNVRVGDWVEVIDYEDDLYMEARILKVESSITGKKDEAVLGEYLIKEDDIHQKVRRLAEQFAEIAKSRTLYTWSVYADDADGTGISLDPDGKKYMGTANNRLTNVPDITDPSVFTWVLIKGGDGMDATVYKLISSATIIKGHRAVQFSPDMITLSLMKRNGNGELEPCENLVSIEYSLTENPVEWIEVVRELTTSYDYTIPTGTVMLRCSMRDRYDHDQGILDQITIPVVFDGDSGTSPTVEVNDDYTLTITDAAGVKTTPVLKGADGNDGTDATSYKMLISAASVKKDDSGIFAPSSITLKGRKQTGTSSFGAYSCRFKIETSTSATLSSWTARYTSSSNVSTYTYTIPAGTTGLRCSMYLAGGTTTLLDQVIIPVVSDGADNTTVSERGPAMFYSSASTSGSSTTQIAYNTVALPSGVSFTTGDLVITSNGQLYRVESQGSGGLNVSYLTSF